MRKINLDEYYSNEEAVDRLSENAGRQVNRNYPRTLARYGYIDSVSLGQRSRLYKKSDIDAYIVTHQRGPKKKAAALA